MRALPRTRNGWGTVYIDPPWRFDDRGSRLAPEGSVSGYHTMSNKEIEAIPIRPIVAEQAHLYCWTTDAHAEVSLRATRRWGFRFVQFIPWLKVDREGKPRKGGGHYFRHVTELCIFATRGKMPTLSEQRIDLDALVVAVRRSHSEKPEAMRRLIAEANAPTPRLEIFARKKTPGWTVFGDQADSGIRRRRPVEAEPQLSVHGQMPLFVR
jgi:N6-adenosine-specific RNA methylase IME4